MKEYFNGFSTQDLVDMRRNDEKRKEKVEMEKEIERQKEIIRQLDIKNLELRTIIKEVREYIETNKENTTQTLRFDENKSYNTALLELLEILDKENNND